MPQTHIYNVADTIVYFADKLLTDGRGVNEISVELPEAYTKTQSADGVTVFNRTNNDTATLTITLLATNPANSVLSKIYNKGRKGRTGQGLGTLLIQSVTSTDRLIAQIGVISQAPTMAFGAEVSERTWTIELSEVDVTFGDIPVAVPNQ
jgi:hypothetical protein